MDRTFGIILLVGTLSGALAGVFIGAAIGNGGVGVAIGALAGLFLSWFGAAARRPGS
jgi:hypothetical protein